MPRDDLVISEELTLPGRELHYVTARSGGPGGQNVNKVETRVTLCFDVARSPSLSAEQRARLLEALGSRLGKKGVLRVSSQRHRTQGENRRAARRRCAELLRQALVVPASRLPTAPLRGARDRRLAKKRHRASLKSSRRRPEVDAE